MKVTLISNVEDGDYNDAWMKLILAYFILAAGPL